MEHSTEEMVPTVSRVFCENIDAALQVFGTPIRKALEEHSMGERTIEDYRRMLKIGEAQLWILAPPSGRMVLAAITRILVYPNKKRLSFDLLVGKDMEASYPHLAQVEKWAAERGCTEVQAYVRPGIRKVMAKYGFTRPYEVITRPIGVV